MAEYLATRLKCVGIRAVGALLRRRNFICKSQIHKSLMQARPFTVSYTLKYALQKTRFPGIFQAAGTHRMTEHIQ